MVSQNGYIYAHKRNDSGIVIYIGMGGFAKSEKSNSFSRAFKLTQRNKHHQAVIDKYGVSVEILAKGLNFDQAVSLEKFFIKAYNTFKKGCNYTLGGEGTISRKFSEKALNSIKEATLNRMNDEVWRSKWYKTMKSQDRSSAVAKNLANRGQKAFNVFYAIKEAKKGVGSGVRSYVKGDFVGTWLNRAQCARALNIPRTHIRACLKGNRKICKGYMFEVING